jgi:hypothetical protein
LGLDVLYNKLNSASSTSGFLGFTPATVNGPLRLDDQDNFQFRFRVHRDFYP